MNTFVLLDFSAAVTRLGGQALISDIALTVDQNVFLSSVNALHRGGDYVYSHENINLFATMCLWT